MAEKKTKKRKKLAPSEDVGDDPPVKAGKTSDTGDAQTLAGAVPIPDNMLKKQSDAQKEKQKKIAEANKALKREKRKNRVKKNKPQKTPDQSPAAVKKTTPEYAISYVTQWKEDKSNWKFQTLVQSWILQNLLDDTKISKADFPLVLEYAVSVRGAARGRLADEMRAVVEARDRWPSLRAEGQTREQAREAIGRDKPTKRAYRRARSVLQSLDDDE
ncbi:uncharacterized protein C7orf50 homolog [Amphibalanus amphitrite]|uniref:uncharacterized protein C7orf50 homolog n=1 Tax=Amphibalanus amphitrite TaxID=1232801 RepID=UPI001C92156B|nr:uncharacterized protein C7orf50 homolog [Amphibalanus amphitrite]XP_043230865.1 uncharacterized protein C7orf50 homolog [Amphibalanus amphitrite]XP_043230866.1 uncharacterized protein C7orf50 homolog [Amphibalanus amphitrite]XP_043230867.1 uncharacterized protein C7orf50 homolog [Amphibalanus amphitrite]XP_043230868.1 uncharacterized protein C7orf50 homolog [Amphibalanus amphitrite]XP_043230870.1 uncharacterized protein C7orf50 homolog [Amphibalanus amphitrite]XP_043230871.1 uncharacterize